MKVNPDTEPLMDEQVKASKERIGAQVIRALGRPTNLCAVVVCPLWENHYRVNVFLGEDRVSAQIANSYFLQADSEGNISSATPEIKKQY